MIITLNEYTLALLCGGVSCLTYIMIHINDINENNLTKRSKNKRVSEDSSMVDDFNILRRPSQISARYRAKRAESIKNEHVIFADEIKHDDEKFTPNPEINDSEVEGILQNNEESADMDSFEDFEAPSLNTFDKSQPLDDLLIRRRSLHSSPAHSRSGSRTGSLRISAPEDNDNSGDEDHAVEDAQDFQVKSLKAELSSLKKDLSQLRASNEKSQNEKKHLETLLFTALAKVYPEKTFDQKNCENKESALQEFVEKML